MDGYFGRRGSIGLIPLYVTKGGAEQAPLVGQREKQIGRKGNEIMENTELQLVKSEQFYGVDCDFYKGNDDEMWLTRNQIAEALEYNKKGDAIENIHRKHRDRLDKFSVTLKLRGTDKKRYNTYMYNERGVMEICRWSRQPKANEFMDWVWDIVQAYRHGTLQPINQVMSVNQSEQLEIFLSQQNKVLEEMKAENKVFQTTMTQGFANMSKLVESLMHLHIDKNGSDEVLDESGEEIRKIYNVKQEIFNKINKYIKGNNLNAKSNNVLSAIYKYMRNNYGIVWEQEIKDYKEQNNLDGWVSTITVIVNNPQLLDILNSILDGSIGDACKQCGDQNMFVEDKILNEWRSIHDKIVDYATEIGNNSTNAMVIYRKIYNMMDVEWADYPANIPKRELIKGNDELFTEFVIQVNRLLGNVD